MERPKEDTLTKAINLKRAHTTFTLFTFSPVYPMYQPTDKRNNIARSFLDNDQPPSVAQI